MDFPQQIASCMALYCQDEGDGAFLFVSTKELKTLFRLIRKHSIIHLACSALISGYNPINIVTKIFL